MNATPLPPTTVIDFRLSLTGRVALVTGGMGGIGWATVQALAVHGVHVAFTYARGHESPAAAEAGAATLPVEASAHALDLADVESIRACVAEVFARWGHVDILVNNAAVGTATVAAFATDPALQDSAMFAINADGTLKMCQTFLAHGAGAPAKIVNISSVGGGVQVFPGFRMSDGMSKAAVAHLTRQLAAELVDSPIDVFALCPGATDTPMFRSSTLDPLGSDERDAFVAALPKGRLIDPAEIAQLIVFLASQYSAPLHGAVVDASLGLGVRPGRITG